MNKDRLTQPKLQ